MIPSPNPGNSGNYLYGATAISPTDVWAVGGYNFNGRTLTEHWDGTSWSVIPSPSLGTTDSWLGAVDAISRAMCVAVYVYYNNGAPTTLTNIGMA